MAKAAVRRFGTAPVFLTAISTILGAILFLRFGYAVGNVGLLGAIGLILIGHAVTIPTGLAIAEIATNLKVEGGGEYYIISRSFGATVGGAIGISLYFSQAISVAFYLIAFAEAFRPLFGWVQAQTGLVPDVRMVSIPAAVVLSCLIIKRGANIGVSALWVVVSILALALGVFFLGKPVADAPTELFLFNKVAGHDDLFVVFAIIFPAFTGMTAGVGLSGDLKNPRKSIPLGTLSATLTGMAVYILVVIKLARCASAEGLATNQFIMSDIALWGPIIPLGLAAATISSAIGSILVAPRTLQALAGDRVLPVPKANQVLGLGKGETNEPVNATIVTAVIILLFVSLGNVNFVAKIISMFFMITYGTLCTISFLEHFAGNPSYRPTFRTKWYLSLVGAVAAFVIMFQMSTPYAALAVVTMCLIYVWIKRSRKGERDLAMVVKGVLFQMTRQLQVLIQKKQARVDMSNWRPSFIAISRNSLTRLGPFDLLRWISHYYGFGSFIHFIKGPLTEETNREAKDILAKLIHQVDVSRAGMYVDTIISPSFKTGVAQIVQIPGIAGMENNSILFEFRKEDEEELQDILEGCHFGAVAGFNICILRSSDKHFGYRRNIHIWLTPGDIRNANLMIILAYIMIGHRDWKHAEVKLFATFSPTEIEAKKKRLLQLVRKGQIPISPNNIQVLPLGPERSFDEFVSETSECADLVVTGFSVAKMKQDQGEFLKGFDGIEDILFVRAGQEILITQDED
jgi:amino acid transporter